MIPKDVLMALDYEREMNTPGETVDPQLRNWIRSHKGKVDPEAVYDEWRKENGISPGRSYVYHYSPTTLLKKQRYRERREELLWELTKEYYNVDHTPQNPQLMALIRKYRNKGMSLAAIGRVIHRHALTLKKWGIE